MIYFPTHILSTGHYPQIILAKVTNFTAIQHHEYHSSKKDFYIIQ